MAEQARVNTVEEAVSFAEKIGYPVVLKPEAEEQGRGVFANIIDKTELKQCFDNASANYKSLILEKFIKGFFLPCTCASWKGNGCMENGTS